MTAVNDELLPFEIVQLRELGQMDKESFTVMLVHGAWVSIYT